jgi:hypothetical protein
MSKRAKIPSTKIKKKIEGIDKNIDQPMNIMSKAKEGAISKKKLNMKK